MKIWMPRRLLLRLVLGSALLFFAIFFIDIDVIWPDFSEAGTVAIPLVALGALGLALTLVTEFRHQLVPVDQRQPAKRCHVALVLAVAALLAVGVLLSWPEDNAWWTLRSFCGSIGVVWTCQGLFCRAWWGALPVLWLVGTASFGQRLPGRELWAWPTSYPTAESFCMAMGLFIAGIWFYLDPFRLIERLILSHRNLQDSTTKEDLINSKAA